jgi:hypothetical protein
MLRPRWSPVPPEWSTECLHERNDAKRAGTKHSLTYLGGVIATHRHETPLRTDQSPCFSSGRALLNKTCATVVDQLNQSAELE